MQANVHPSGYSVRDFTHNGPTEGSPYSRPFVSLDVTDNGSVISIYLNTPEQADDLIAAALEARSHLARRQAVA